MRRDLVVLLRQGQERRGGEGRAGRRRRRVDVDGARRRHEADGHLLRWRPLGRARAYLADDLRMRVASDRVQLTTDSHNAYLGAIEDAFGADADYAHDREDLRDRSGRRRRPLQPARLHRRQEDRDRRRPRRAHVSTSYVERSNLSIRMQNRRFTRLTNAFSKKFSNHVHALALYFMFYNFVRMHKTLRMTPCDGRWRLCYAVDDGRYRRPYRGAPTQGGAWQTWPARSLQEARIAAIDGIAEPQSGGLAMAVPRPKADRYPWAFQPHGMTDEVRRTRALEFTAHYLDRIDLSLERIATALESGGGNERLRLTLETIAEVLRHRPE